jgi:hypothetical protein
MGTHDGFPLWPFGVLHTQGDRSTLGDAVADPAGEVNTVCLELHPGTAAVTEAPAREIRLDLLDQEWHTGGKTLQHTNELRAV